MFTLLSLILLVKNMNNKLNVYSPKANYDFGSNRQRNAFLSSINKDYEALVKDEEDPSEE
jgi:hypothetical protein